MRYLVFMLLLLLAVQPVFAQTLTPTPDNKIDPDQNLTLIWEFAESQPDDFAVACMPLNERGRTIIHNSGERFPLASVSKLLIFLEFARRIDEGLINDAELVPIDELNRYDLPRTDRGAHDDFLDAFAAGWSSLSLWTIASEGMISYSSNAASDYMLARMAPIDWDILYGTLFLTNTDVPHPLGMIPLLMNNHETGQPSSADIPSLSLEQGIGYFDSYVNDPEWREAEIQYRTGRRRSFPSWEIQSEILQQHTATGTVLDMIYLMAAIYGDSTYLTQNTKDITREAMRWYGYERIDNTYFEYGSKLGFYSGGTLALVAYGYPVDGQPVVSVILMRNIPRDSYNQMVRADVIGDMAHWMNLNSCAGLLSQVTTATAGNP